MDARALVARNMRRIRVARGLSQEALAVGAEIDRTYVSWPERNLDGDMPGWGFECVLAWTVKSRAQHPTLLSPGSLGRLGDLRGYLAEVSAGVVIRSTQRERAARIDRPV